MSSLAEVHTPELLRLHRRQPGCGEHLDNLICDVPLVAGKARRIAPAQSSADVVMHPRLRVCDLVSAPIQFPYLLEQRLEHLVIDRHRRRSLVRAGYLNAQASNRTPLSKIATPSHSIKRLPDHRPILWITDLAGRGSGQSHRVRARYARRGTTRLRTRFHECPPIGERAEIVGRASRLRRLSLCVPGAQRRSLALDKRSTAVNRRHATTRSDT